MYGSGESDDDGEDLGLEVCLLAIPRGATRGSVRSWLMSFMILVA